MTVHAKDVHKKVCKTKSNINAHPIRIKKKERREARVKKSDDGTRRCNTHVIDEGASSQILAAFRCNDYKTAKLRSTSACERGFIVSSTSVTR